jgi:hypothetical protein
MKMLWKNTYVAVLHLAVTVRVRSSMTSKTSTCVCIAMHVMYNQSYIKHLSDPSYIWGSSGPLLYSSLNYIGGCQAVDLNPNENKMYLMKFVSNLWQG